MALTADRGMVAGAYYVQIAFRDANGYPKGQETVPDTIVADTTTHAYLVGGLVGLSPSTPTVSKASNFSGQRKLGSMVLGITDFGTPQVTLAEYNEVLNAYIKGTTADVATMVNWVMNAANTGQTSFPRFITMITGKYLSSVDLKEYYMTWMFHNTQWTVATGAAVSQADGTNPNPVVYDIELTESLRMGTGMLFSAAGMSVVDNSDTGTQIRTEDPIALTTWVADGIAVVFTLGYRPIYSTADGTTNNSFTLNGVATAVTSCVTTTGVVTISAAGTTGDIWVAVYPTDWVAI